jgi:hypothetical protein
LIKRTKKKCVLECKNLPNRSFRKVQLKMDEDSTCKLTPMAISWAKDYWWESVSQALIGYENQIFFFWGRWKQRIADTYFLKEFPFFC